MVSQSRSLLKPAQLDFGSANDLPTETCSLNSTIGYKLKFLREASNAVEIHKLSNKPTLIEGFYKEEPILSPTENSNLVVNPALADNIGTSVCRSQGNSISSTSWSLANQQPYHNIKQSMHVTSPMPVESTSEGNCAQLRSQIEESNDSSAGPVQDMQQKGKSVSQFFNSTNIAESKLSSSTHLRGPVVVISPITHKHIKPASQKSDSSIPNSDKTVEPEQPTKSNTQGTTTQVPQPISKITARTNKPQNRLNKRSRTLSSKITAKPNASDKQTLSHSIETSNSRTTRTRATSNIGLSPPNSLGERNTNTAVVNHVDDFLCFFDRLKNAHVNSKRPGVPMMASAYGKKSRVFTRQSKRYADSSVQTMKSADDTTFSTNNSIAVTQQSNADIKLLNMVEGPNRKQESSEALKKSTDQSLETNQGTSLKESDDDTNRILTSQRHQRISTEMGEIENTDMVDDSSSTLKPQACRADGTISSPSDVESNAINPESVKNRRGKPTAERMGVSTKNYSRQHLTGKTEFMGSWKNSNTDQLSVSKSSFSFHCLNRGQLLNSTEAPKPNRLGTSIDCISRSKKRTNYQHESPSNTAHTGPLLPFPPSMNKSLNPHVHHGQPIKTTCRMSNNGKVPVQIGSGTLTVQERVIVAIRDRKWNDLSNIYQLKMDDIYCFHQLVVDRLRDFKLLIAGKNYLGRQLYPFPPEDSITLFDPRAHKPIKPLISFVDGPGGPVMDDLHTAFEIFPSFMKRYLYTLFDIPVPCR